MRRARCGARRRGRFDARAAARRRACPRPAAGQRRRPHLHQDHARRAIAGDPEDAPAWSRRSAGAGGPLGSAVGHGSRRTAARRRLHGHRAGQHRRRVGPLHRRPPHRPDRHGALDMLRGARTSARRLRESLAQGAKQRLSRLAPASDLQLLWTQAFIGAARRPRRRRVGARACSTAAPSSTG